MINKVHGVLIGLTPQPVKSSYSTGYNNCLMVASPSANGVEVTDSKIDDSPVIKIGAVAFAEFVNELR